MCEINAQLIYAPTETQVWADKFDRDMRDVLALQSEIAHAVTRQLRVRLGDGDPWRRAQQCRPGGV